MALWIMMMIRPRCERTQGRVSSLLYLTYYIDMSQTLGVTNLSIYLAGKRISICAVRTQRCTILICIDCQRRRAEIMCKWMIEWVNERMGMGTLIPRGYEYEKHVMQMWLPFLWGNRTEPEELQRVIVIVIVIIMLYLLNPIITLLLFSRLPNASDIMTTIRTR